MVSGAAKTFEDHFGVEFGVGSNDADIRSHFFQHLMIVVVQGVDTATAAKVFQLFTAPVDAGDQDAQGVLLNGGSMVVR